MRRSGSLLKEIAQSMGISVSTVYAALQDRKDISEATRQRVQEKARSFHYSPDLLARSMKTRETKVIGLVVPDLSGSFFVDVIKGIDAVAHNAGYHVLLCTTSEDAAREDAEIATLLGRRVDGLILASAHVSEDPRGVEPLNETGTPFVLIDRRLTGGEFIGCDETKVGYLATRHLIEAGYGRIAHLRGPNVSTGNERYAGYVKALKQAGIALRPEYVKTVRFHEELSGGKAMSELLALNPAPDAVFAASDPIAIAAIEAAGQLGVRVPEDVGVVGVGNHRYTPFLRVPLTTVDQNRAEIGKRAAERLLMKIHSGKFSATERLIEPQLLVRQSTNRKTSAPGSSARRKD